MPRVDVAVAGATLNASSMDSSVPVWPPGTDASPREGLTLVPRTCAAVSLRVARVRVVNVWQLRERWFTNVRCVNGEYPYRINEIRDVAKEVTSRLRCKAWTSLDSHGGRLG